MSSESILDTYSVLQLTPGRVPYPSGGIPMIHKNTGSAAKSKLFISQTTAWHVPARTSDHHRRMTLHNIALHRTYYGARGL